MARKKQSQESSARSGRNLWVVQLIEYILGFGIAAATINAGKPFGLALVAVIIIGNAACVKSSLSAFRVTTPRMHQSLGVAAALLAVLIALFIPMDVSGQLIVIAVAVAQGFLSVRFGHGF
jgi:hypothetical protein